MNVYNVWTLHRLHAAATCIHDRASAVGDQSEGGLLSGGASVSCGLQVRVCDRLTIEHCMQYALNWPQHRQHNDWREGDWVNVLHHVRGLESFRRLKYLPSAIAQPPTTHHVVTFKIWLLQELSTVLWPRINLRMFPNDTGRRAVPLRQLSFLLNYVTRTVSSELLRFCF